MNHTTNKKEQIDDIEIVSNMDKFFFFCFFQKSNTKIKITKFRMCNLYFNNIFCYKRRINIHENSKMWIHLFGLIW